MMLTALLPLVDMQTLEIVELHDVITETSYDPLSSQALTNLLPLLSTNFPTWEFSTCGSNSDEPMPILIMKPQAPSVKVDVISLSSRLSLDELKQLLMLIPEHFPNWEFRIYNPDPADAGPMDCIAGSAEYRTQVFKQAWSSDSDVIWFMRGGVGSLGLIDLISKFLDEEQKQGKVSNKILAGYSDVSVLLTYLAQKYPFLTCLHAPMVFELVDSTKISNVIKAKEYIEKIIQIDSKCCNDQELFQNIKKFPGGQRLVNYPYSNLYNRKWLAYNVSTVQSALGTEWASLDIEDAVLFFEEVGGVSGRLHRHMHRFLEQITAIMNMNRKYPYAIIIGSISQGEEESSDPEIKRQINQFAGQIAKLGCNVFKVETFGHGAINVPFQLGYRARLELTRVEIALSPLLSQKNLLSK
jgi:muramoyltetrapeptide carboxypeptidase LdcA involved in peptidoglycan recycling